ncbi:MAG: response regulator [Candidatus Krumholzibacteriia bacterium]
MSESGAKHVLLVEDDPAVRRILALQLQTRGYEVRTAADGAEGFRALQEDLPDCVVLDLMMPVMDGFELLKRIRCLGRTANLPVLVLTASEDDRHRLRTQQYLADAYANKPYELDRLVLTIDRLAGNGVPR